MGVKNKEVMEMCLLVSHVWAQTEVLTLRRQVGLGSRACREGIMGRKRQGREWKGSLLW